MKAASARMAMSVNDPKIFPFIMMMRLISTDKNSEILRIMHWI